MNYLYYCEWSGCKFFASHVVRRGMGKDREIRVCDPHRAVFVELSDADARQVIDARDPVKRSSISSAFVTSPPSGLAA
jgi:hypothetical protein